MDDQQFERLISILTAIAGELEKIAEYMSDAPNGDATVAAFGYLKRIAEASEYGKY